MNREKLRQIILNECGCMAREVDMPAHISAALPMLDILGYGHEDGAPPVKKRGGGLRFEDSDAQEESGMIKNNLYNLAYQAQELHDAMDDNDDVPEWVQEKIAVASEMIDVIYDYLGAESARAEMHEGKGKKPWYMKRRTNMKKAEGAAWYDIPRKKKKVAKKK